MKIANHAYAPAPGSRLVRLTVPALTAPAARNARPSSATIAGRLAAISAGIAASSADHGSPASAGAGAASRGSWVGGGRGRGAPPPRTKGGGAGAPGPRELGPRRPAVSPPRGAA